jgi:hypothetical protein
VRFLMAGCGGLCPQEGRCTTTTTVLGNSRERECLVLICARYLCSGFVTLETSRSDVCLHVLPAACLRGV